MAVLTCAILSWIIVEDMRRFIVRNALVLALVACFVADCVLHDRMALLLSHGIFAAVCLACLVGAFMARMIGGGDAKLLSAALLWTGPDGAFVFALLLLVGTGLYGLGAWAGRLPARKVNGRTIIPFGPCIAAAWIVHIAVTTLFWAQLTQIVVK